MIYKIAVDITSTQDQFAHRGVGNYTRNVVEEMIAQSDSAIEWHLIGFGSQQELANNIPIAVDPKLKAQRRVIFHSLGSKKTTSPFNFIWWQRRLWPTIKSISPHLYFSPEMQRGVPIGYCKTAVMIHDIIPVVTGKYSPRNPLFNLIKGIIYRMNLRHALHADLVITNSQFSAAEIDRVFKLPMSKITPIYLAPNKRSFDYTSTFKKAVLEKYGLWQDGKPARFIHYNGGFEANKNIELLVRSFAVVVKQIPDIKLVIVGKEVERLPNGQYNPNTSPAAKLMQLILDLINNGYPELEGKIVFTGFAPEAEMPVLLKEASAFAHLASYEGFGLSIIEAMSVGVPTIAANASCYPEIAKDGARLVDLQQSAVVDGILSVLQDPAISERLSKAGVKVAKEYSWQKTAAQTLAKMQTLLN